MKILNKLVIPLTTILLTIFSVWLITNIITGSRSYYKWQFNKNDTYNNLEWTTPDNEVISYDEEDIELIINSIIDYLFSRSDTMQLTLDGKTVFSNQALIHMRDVKRVYNIFTIIAISCAVLLVGLFIYIYLNFSNLKKGMLKNALITYGVIFLLLLLLGIFIIIDFDTAFDYFHRILFPNEKYDDAFFSWKSNYEEEPHINNLLLVTVLSVEVFSDAAFIIITFTIFIILLWLLFIYFIRKTIKEKNKTEIIIDQSKKS